MWYHHAACIFPKQTADNNFQHIMLPGWWNSCQQEDVSGEFPCVVCLVSSKAYHQNLNRKKITASDSVFIAFLPFSNWDEDQQIITFPFLIFQDLIFQFRKLCLASFYFPLNGSFRAKINGHILRLSCYPVWISLTRDSVYSVICFL